MHAVAIITPISHCHARPSATRFPLALAHAFAYFTLLCRWRTSRTCCGPSSSRSATAASSTACWSSATASRRCGTRSRSSATSASASARYAHNPRLSPCFTASVRLLTRTSASAARPAGAARARAGAHRLQGRRHPRAAHHRRGLARPAPPRPPPRRQPRHVRPPSSPATQPHTTLHTHAHARGYDDNPVASSTESAALRGVRSSVSGAPRRQPL